MAFVRFRCVPAFYIYNKKHNKTKQKHIFQNKSSSSSKLHPFEEMEKRDLQFWRQTRMISCPFCLSFLLLPSIAFPSYPSTEVKKERRKERKVRQKPK